MLRTAARIFGIVFVLVGILGFVPGITRDGHMLLGVFHVNAAHNLVHLLSGIVALVASSGVASSRTFFRAFGVIYGLVAILGALGGDKPVLGFIANNVADVWLHVAIAVTSLVLGFAVKPEPEAPRPIGPAHPAA